MSKAVADHVAAWYLQHQSEARDKALKREGVYHDVYYVGAVQAVFGLKWVLSVSYFMEKPMRVRLRKLRTKWRNRS